MSTDFFETMPRKAMLAGWAIILGPLIVLVVLGAIFFKVEPINPDAVLGCYVSANSPPLDVQSDTIRIMDGSNRSFSYVAEVKPKLGYHLNVRPALALAPQAGDMLGFKQMPGIGYFWPLLASTSDDPDKLRSPDDFGGRFSMFGRNGERVIYTRVQNEGRCRK